MRMSDEKSSPSIGSALASGDSGEISSLRDSLGASSPSANASALARLGSISDAAGSNSADLRLLFLAQQQQQPQQQQNQNQLALSASLRALLAQQRLQQLQQQAGGGLGGLLGGVGDVNMSARALFQQQQSDHIMMAEHIRLQQQQNLLSLAAASGGASTSLQQQALLNALNQGSLGVLSNLASLGLDPASLFGSSSLGGGSGTEKTLISEAATNEGCELSDDPRKSKESVTKKSNDEHEEDEQEEHEGKESEEISDTFPYKLYRMVSDAEKEGNDGIVSFNASGKCFMIHKPREFVTQIMPKYFTTSRMSSFQRQLNLYGFRRISEGPDKGGYVHDHFLRDRKKLCRKIKRKKPSIKLPPPGLCYADPSLLSSGLEGAHASLSVRQMIADGQLSEAAMQQLSLLNPAVAAVGGFAGAYGGGGLTANSTLAAALLMDQQLRHQQQQQEQQQRADLIQQLLLRQQQEHDLLLLEQQRKQQQE